MIAGLHGTLESLTADALLINVGGVVYRVFSSGATLATLGPPGDPVRMVTHLIVREDQLTLYGFATQDELRLFEMLIGVTGVGPRVACAMLSHLPLDLLYEAILSENVALLATVPGVGKKTGARLALELRGKLPQGMVIAGRTAEPEDADVIEALRSLGYTGAEAHQAVLRTSKQSGLSTEERIIAALRELADN